MADPRKRRPVPPVDGSAQVGRRPSSVGFLFAVAAMWIVVGIVALISLHASWRLVPGIVFIGVGLLYLRAAAATALRRNR
jgi:hypothetical protein